MTVSELVNVMEMRHHKHSKLKYFEIYARQHGTCVNFSQKSAHISKNNTQDTVDRQDVCPSS